MAKFQFTNEGPTEKQVLFARDIACALNLEMPAERTKAAYSEFISRNIGRYRDALSEVDWYDFDKDDYGDR